LANFRRSERYVFQLQVLFKGTYRARPALTDDISFHGVFIRTDESRQPNQLVKFTIVDPDSDEHVDLLGIVARAVAPDRATTDRPPGIGVSLFGNNRAVEARWVKLVRRVKSWSQCGHTEPPPSPGIGTTPAPARAITAAPTPLPTPEPQSLRPAPPSMPPVPGAGVVREPPRRTGTLPSLPRPPRAETAPLSKPPPEAAPPRPETEPIDAVKRAHVRRPGRFNVTLRPEGLDALEAFEMRDVSEGGTFVLTPQLLPVGSRINLRLVHPTSGDTFSIPGQVVRSIDSIDPQEKGIGIRFNVDGIDGDQWSVFMQRHAPVAASATPLLPTGDEMPTVSVTRTPAPAPPEPAVLLGRGETPAPGVLGPDPGGAAILLDETEAAVPLILGDGVESRPPATPPPLPPLPRKPR